MSPNAESTESAPYTGLVTSDPKVHILPLGSYTLPYKEQNALQISAVPAL